MSIDLMHGTTFVSYSRLAVAANLRGRGLSQSSPSCYSETASFQDGKQSQMHSHGFYLTIATTETFPGLGGYATCRFLVLADGLYLLFVCVCLSLSVCFVSMFVCLSVCPSVCLSVCLSREE